MKKHNVICGVICVVAVVVALFLKMKPRTVPFEQCSEVYKQYCNVEGVRATYIQDFRVNDTLTVGVTLLEATDSAGWSYLVEAFNITQEMLFVFEQADMDIFSWQSCGGRPEIRVATKGKDADKGITNNDIEMCTCSLKKGKICIFHTQSKEEIVAIDNYNFDKMIDKKNL